MPNRSQLITRTIKQARVTKGLSQEQLAAKTGIARSTLNQIERGKRSLTDETRLSIAAALDIDPSLLKHESESELDEIESLLSQFRLLSRQDFEVARDALEISINMARAKKDTDDFVKKMALKKWAEVRSFFQEAARGAIELKASSPLDATIEFLKQATDSISATSCVDPKIWWGSPLGRWYQDENIRIKQRNREKLDMARVFIFENADESEDAKVFILPQLDAGIRIWVGYQDELPPGRARDLMFIDDRYAAFQTFLNRKVIEVTRFSTIKEEREEAKRIFEDMKNYSDPVQDEKQLKEIIKKRREREATEIR